MPASDSQICEVKINGGWQAISLTEARGAYAMAQKRCIACHGQVIVSGTYTGLGRFKIQHRRTHDGCPLIPQGYSGTPSPHPRALT